MSTSLQKLNVVMDPIVQDFLESLNGQGDLDFDKLSLEEARGGLSNMYCPT